MRMITLAVAAIMLTASLAIADPNVMVLYPNGVPRVQLEGDYAHSTYTVLRADHREGPYVSITQQGILCLGSCFADDRSATPGTLYWYRFDLLLPDGTRERYGPYAVTYSPSLLGTVGARVQPNPVRGAATLELHIVGESGAPAVMAEATLFDAQGRRVRSLFNGPLARGITRLRWDGRDARGLATAPGLYLLRFSTPLGSSVTRVVRAD